MIAKIDLLKIDVELEKVVEQNFSKNAKTKLTEVFIVHGHNSELKIAVARILEKLGLTPVILHEQSNAGKTIIEKFEFYSNVGFAVFC